MGDGIAIVGMACTFPKARTLSRFWENILNKVDAVTDVSPERWDTDVFYDPDPAAEDRIYCKKGGWIGSSFAFNPLRYGIMPSTIDGAEPDHFLVLRTVDEALADAGYADRAIDGNRVSVIIGKGNYLGPGVTALMYRGIIAEQTLAVIKGLHPEFTPRDLAAIKAAMRTTLPKMTPEVASGLIPNICSGRVANRFDFMGRNFTVDAACASSLIATELGVEGLTSGRDDLVLVGGVHIFAQIPFLQVFDTMRALSLTSRIRPFDEHADGTICGEGVGILVLKRLGDAERDRDRIYALIKGVASASDGRAKSVTAPRVEGEELALRRAYDISQIPPQSVGLIEAHGTATPIGDAAEIDALNHVFGAASDGMPTCAVGSVKSMIGHAMPAAGAAGLIKAALALSQGVLPPTLNCDTPRSPLGAADSRFYVNTETRPWIRGESRAPRRAGVNAFGFGGINAHVVLEEYVGPCARHERVARQWKSEVVFVDADTRVGLVAAIDRLRTYAEAADGVDLLDIASTLNAGRVPSPHRLTVVASSIDDLARKLDVARRRLDDPACAQIKDRDGLYYIADPDIRGGQVAMLFPGEGSQSVNMLAELCVHFPEVRRAFDLADGAVLEPGRWPASAMVFPPPLQSIEAAAAAERRLWSIDRATEAVLTADAAILNLFECLGLTAGMMAGHSAGEWIAMAAAGVVDRDEFIGSLSTLSAIHRNLDADATIPRLSLLAVGAGRETVDAVAREIDAHVDCANDNCPHQVVIVVAPADEEAVVQALKQRGIYVERLPFDRGYHSESFACICEPLRQYFSAMTIRPARVPLYSCTTADLYPGRPDQIIDLVSSSFARPLRFRETVETMYAAGARIFVEAGPRGNLTAFVDDILRGRPHLTVAIDQAHRTGLLALNHMIGALASAGVALDLEWMYRRRSARHLTFNPDTDGLDVDRAPGAVPISTCYPKLQPPLPATQYGAPAAEPRAAAAPEPAVLLASMASQSAAAPPTPADVGASGNGRAHTSLIEEHCALMEQFLTTHEAVMVGYRHALGGASTVRLAACESVAAETVVAVTDARPEVDPSVPPIVRTDAAQLKRDVSVEGAVRDRLLQIVGERTGYPADMLGLDLDMEADLGIDSIKRVEIFSALAQAGNGASHLTESRMDDLARLKTLREVLAFLARVDEPSAARSQAASPRALGPMIRSAAIVDEVRGQSVTLQCVVDSREHRYLRHHSLYYPAGDSGGQDSRLVAMPMTGTLEIMAEAASLLCPGLKVIGAEGIQAMRWINFEAPSFRTALTITAHLAGRERVQVEVRCARAGEEGASLETVGAATILFADRYPDPPAPGAVALTNPRSSACSASEIYSSHRMFHGPSFQGVTSLSAVAEDGLHGTLTIRPTDDVLASDPEPAFHIHPFLFDMAGQLVGYWPTEFLQEGYVALPVGVAAIAIYGDRVPTGSVFDCRVRIADVNARRIRADIDLVGDDGQLMMRVERWEDRRFYWPDHIYNFWRFPDSEPNGVRVDLPAHPDVECRRIDVLGEIDNNGLWETLWMHMVLNSRELQACRQIAGRDARRAWLLRRAVAKDAVRMWVRRHDGLVVCAPDVDIEDDGNGSIVARGGWTAQLKDVPHVAVMVNVEAGFGAASASPLTLVADGSGVHVLTGDAPMMHARL